MNFEMPHARQFAQESASEQVVERIVASALKCNGEIFTGMNHGFAYEAFIAHHPEAKNNKQVEFVNGFMTNTGRFVLRPEALEIGERADQNKDDAGQRIPGQLSSEDLKSY